MAQTVRSMEELEAWLRSEPTEEYLSRIVISRRRNEFKGGSIAKLCKVLPRLYGRLEALVLYDDELTSSEGLDLIGKNGPMIEELNLGRNSLSEIVGLKEFPGLTSLWLEDNGLRSLPGLDSLKSLRILRLTHNRLMRLDVSGLAELAELAVDSNELTELPAGIGGCRNLKLLNARQNLIATLPEFQPGDCAELHTLSLSSNRLTSIPASLSRLGELSTLLLNANQLEDLPAALFGPGKLTRVNLASNKLDFATVKPGDKCEPYGFFTRDPVPAPPNDRFVDGDRVIVVAYNTPQEKEQDEVVPEQDGGKEDDASSPTPMTLG